MALDHLARVLADEDPPPAIRHHVPRSISAFGSARAAEILSARLPHERDGRVLYKILRGLGRLRADDPSMPVDRDTLMAVAERHLERIERAAECIERAGKGIERAAERIELT